MVRRESTPSQWGRVGEPGSPDRESKGKTEVSKEGMEEAIFHSILSMLELTSVNNLGGSGARGLSLVV
jgi:hypothetical protein